MLIDLVLEGREALVVGEGKEPEFKVAKLLDARAKVTVLGRSFTPGTRRLASKSHGAVRLVEADPTAANLARAMSEVRPRVVFISTGDPALDEELAGEARRSGGAIICVVDDPRLNDFNMPAIAKAGDIRVGVSTGGKSPAMAGVIRRRMEKEIRREDVLQVRLQGHLRKLAKEKLKDAASRKDFAYKVIGDRRVSALLKKGDYVSAKRVAEKMLRQESPGA